MICPYNDKECPWDCSNPCRPASPIVPSPAKDDGRGRISAYDTTWPDLKAKYSTRDVL